MLEAGTAKQAGIVVHSKIPVGVRAVIAGRTFSTINLVPRAVASMMCTWATAETRGHGVHRNIVALGLLLGLLGALLGSS